MMNQRTDRTLIVILLSAMLSAAFGCGEEDNSSTADMSGEEPSTASTAGIRGLLVDNATKRTLGNTRVRLVDSQGKIRTILTTQAGVFEFENLPTGREVYPGS